ncbi:MAG: hypothetical protein ABIF01_03980 [Candidatus Micrarchaeota archaeon]
MHIVSLSAGVLFVGASIYLLLSVAYPFLWIYPEQPYSNLVVFTCGVLFGGIGSYLSWNSVVGLEDGKVGRKIHRKRKRRFALARVEEGAGPEL